MPIKIKLKNILFFLLLFFFCYAYSADASNGTKIYAIGDSLTDSYQTKLATLLGHSCKVVMNSSIDSSCEIIYKGLRGNATIQILERFKSEILTKRDAKYIIIWGGINDIGSGNITVEATKNNLQAMYTMAHNAGIKVIAINISPFKDSTVWNWSQEKQESLDAVNNWIANQAVDIDYRIDAYTLFEDKNKADMLLSKYDYGDHLHLNSDGQDLIGSIVYSAVDWEISTPTTSTKNPTAYQSLQGDYGRATDDKTGYYQMPEVTVTGYLSKFRIFIPPGTIDINMVIYEYGGQTAIARQRIPPTTYSVPQDYFKPQSTTIEKLLVSDQIISENLEGKITIINQGIPAPYVSLDQSGWLYVYVTGGSYSSVYYNKFLIGVDAATYDNWYDHSGSNSDGSINWAKDVEGVETYVAKTQTSPTPTPTPTPSSTPTCEINFTKTKDDQTKITSATEGEIKGQWQKITNYDATKQDAYSVCEDELTTTLTKINPTNQTYTGKEWKFNYNGHVDERCYILFFKKDETPKSDWSNRLSSCQTDLIKVNEIPAPTGPDCAIKTCQGNSCDSQNKAIDNPWINGTKTEGCATITATVDPNALTTPGSTFIKWTSTGASKVEAECFSGPIIIPRGGWFTSDAKCKESGMASKCTDKGYEFIAKTELAGTEICKFYPTNSADTQQGTPLIITFEVKKASATPTPTPTTTATPTVTPIINCTYPDPLDFCRNGTIRIVGKDSTGCDVHICEQVNCSYPDPLDFCPNGTIIKTGEKVAGCDLYRCDKTVLSPTKTPTPSPASTSTCHISNPSCPSDVCASKFCDDGCNGLMRGAREGC